MATLLDYTGDDERRQRTYYPWQDWAAEPFPVVIVRQGDDFTVTLKGFEMTIRVYASRNKLAISLQKDLLNDRMMFRFGPKGTHPGLPGFPPIQATGATGGAACRVCGAALQEGFLPHDVLGECFERNPQDARDSDLYLTHRPDPSSVTGLRQVSMIQIVQGNIAITEDGPLEQE